MNLGEFAKQKLLNFVLFVDPSNIKDFERLQATKPVNVLITLDATLSGCKEAIAERDIDKVISQLSHLQVSREQFDRLEQKDRFWRYLDCFVVCINSEEDH